MAINFNMVILGGNLTRDPEQRYTNDGTEIAQFGLAQNERWTDRKTGEKREKANYFDIVAYGGLAGVINEHFYKGKPILVTAKADYSTWEAQDGSTRSKVQFKMLGFEFVPENNGGQRASGNGIAQASGGGRASVNVGGGRQQREEIDESDFEDIPF